MQENNTIQTELKYCVSIHYDAKKSYNLLSSHNQEKFPYKKFSLDFYKNLDVLLGALTTPESTVKLSHYILDSAAEIQKPSCICYMLFFNDLDNASYFLEKSSYFPLICEHITQLVLTQENKPDTPYFVRLSNATVLNASLDKALESNKNKSSVNKI